MGRPKYTYEKLVTSDLICSLVAFDFETQDMVWNTRQRDMFHREQDFITWNKRFSGQRCFSYLDSKNYYRGSVFRYKIPKHRVCWCFYYGSWPKTYLDHINGDRTDNSKNNLREVTARDNARNSSLSSSNTSGHTGVYLAKGGSGWRAGLTIGSSYKSLGVFRSIEDAVEARRLANEKYGFHENHGKPKW
jgi:hypothetical protein